MTKYFSLPSLFAQVQNPGEGSLLDAHCVAPLDNQTIEHVGASLLTKSSTLDGVLLIEASDGQKSTLEALTGITLYENQFFDLPDLQPLDLQHADSDGVRTQHANVFNFIAEDPTGIPVQDVAFKCKVGNQLGEEHFSDENGRVRIELFHDSIPLLYVAAKQGFWPIYLMGRAPSQVPERVRLTPIDLKTREKYESVLGVPSIEDGAGVRIAVIDSGVNNHIDLPNVKLRTAIVNAEMVNDTFEPGIDHGTHVAGVIGCANPDVLGHAPAAEIYSYRVCAPGSRKMSALDVVVAITEAVLAKVDIINLSLGFDFDFAPIAVAVEFALSEGVLVVAASGNEAKTGASFPARMVNVISVSAIGKVNGYPHGTQAANQSSKESKGEFFVAHFCNTGQNQVQCAAPGVGIVSTVQEGGYMASSGTSCAAPLISALAATLLSKNLAELGPRSVKRMLALSEMLYDRCNPLEFHVDSVGRGVPHVR